jgi:sugar (pentulose or hexulose) kinase
MHFYFCIMKSADKTTRKSLVIGLDCSITGTKAIAFDKKGRIVAAENPIVAGSGDGQAAGLSVNAPFTGRPYLNLGAAVVVGIYRFQYKTKRMFQN